MKLGLSPLQGTGSFDETIRECERAEAAGFDSVWLGEHHNNPVLYPAPLLGLAAIAARTSRVSLGTGVLLLPLYHPMGVAEEGAMVDMISGGRLILGVGAGYAPEEFAAFGLSVKQRGSRLEEGAALLRRLWTETHVTHQGRYYHVEDATVGPRPVQQPAPPIWFGAWTAPAIDRAARLGDAWLGGPSAALTELSLCARSYRQARAEMGKEPGEVAAFRYVFVADTTEQALASAGDSFIQAYENMYFRLAAPRHQAAARRADHRAARRESHHPGRSGDLHPGDLALPARTGPHPSDLPFLRPRHLPRRVHGIPRPLRPRGHAGPDVRTRRVDSSAESSSRHQLAITAFCTRRSRTRRRSWLTAV